MLLGEGWTNDLNKKKGEKVGVGKGVRGVPLSMSNSDSVHIKEGYTSSASGNTSKYSFHRDWGPGSRELCVTIKNKTIETDIGKESDVTNH